MYCLSLRCAILPVLLPACLLASPALAFDAGSAWGTTGSSGGSNGFLESSALHANNGSAAVITENGRDSLLPGASITTIGVFNQLSVVGDDNTVTADQTGDNSGDVTSDTDISYHEEIQLLEQPLFPAP